MALLRRCGGVIKALLRHYGGIMAALWQRYDGVMVRIDKDRQQEEGISV